jgi:succinate dehydrogenase / fumarate reductase iron-sulfur subunit
MSATSVTGLAGVQPAPPDSDSGPDDHLLDLTLHVWRQAGSGAEGEMVRYAAPGISTHMSFLEMLDVVNERLIKEGKDPIAFDHDCREGICGMCGLVINGVAHGPQAATTTCQLHMRHFTDGDIIYVEPWRAGPFPVIKDLIVDRGALDRIIEAGGFITAPTGSAAEANAAPVAKDDADLAFDNAACIGCGACVAACPNASAMLFTAAKLSHLAALPQGQPEREHRTLAMVAAQDSLGFGGCTNIGECAAVCPKEIPMESIARMNRELLRASLKRGRSKRR